MTVVHIVLFKFRSTITDLQQTEFVKAAKQLRLLGCVKDGRLIIQRGSITKPIAKSKGYEAALVSFHHDATAVDVYQDSPEHEKFKQDYVLPLTEDLIRFDFEVEKEDEALVGVLPGLLGIN